NGGRKADSTRVGHRLQSRSDIHAIAVEVTAFDDHVAEIQSDTQDDCPVFRQRRVRLSHRFLNINRALYRINGTCELGQGAVAHKPNDATSVFGEQRFENRFAPVSQARQRSRLVLFHEPALAHNICGEYGSEAALGAFFGHVAQLVSENAVTTIVLTPRGGVYRAEVCSGSI